jgi:hypothetical protein
LVLVEARLDDARRVLPDDARRVLPDEARRVLPDEARRAGLRRVADLRAAGDM